MRHWYLLAKELTRAMPWTTSEASDAFVAWGGPESSDANPRPVRTRLFILGAIEMLPVGGALSFGSYFEPAVPYAGTATVGLAFSLLVCWLLRHQTPPTAIHASSDAASHEEKPCATKTDAA